MFYSLFCDIIKKKGVIIMFKRYELTDQQWEQIASLFPPEILANGEDHQKTTVLC